MGGSVRTQRGKSGAGLALTHLPGQAVHCLLHLPQVRLGLLLTLSQALQRSPLCAFPLALCLGHGHPVRPEPGQGGWTDRQTQHTSDSEHMHRGRTQPRTAGPGMSPRSPGLGHCGEQRHISTKQAWLSPLPTAAPAAHRESAETESRQPAHTCRKGDAGQGGGPGPTAKVCACVFTAMPSTHSKGEQPIG